MRQVAARTTPITFADGIPQLGFQLLGRESVQLRTPTPQCPDGSLPLLSEKCWTEHPCQKPLELLLRIVKIWNNAGVSVLHCFLGSGAVPLACEKFGRRSVGVENAKNTAGAQVVGPEASVPAFLSALRRRLLPIRLPRR